MRVFDAFCSNGSSGIDKEFFNSSNVIKNDIRNGTFLVGGKQKINIVRNTSFDIFEKCFDFDNDNDNYFDLIYLDPPHSLKTTGLINEKYTHLPFDGKRAISNMFYNVSCLSGKKTFIVMKWSSIEIKLNDILSIAKLGNIFPMFGSRIKTNLHGIVLRFCGK